MSAPAVRRQLLEEFLRTELFCRRGRELGLDREEGYQQARDQLAQNLLAERFLARELEKVRPTEVDLESYFKANLPQYETPESLQVIAVRLEPKEESTAVLGKIKSADDFRKWAASRQPAGVDPKAASRQIARGQKDAELGDVERLFASGRRGVDPRASPSRQGSFPRTGGEEDAATHASVAGGAGACSRRITWPANNRSWPRNCLPI